MRWMAWQATYARPYLGEEANHAVGPIKYTLSASWDAPLWSIGTCGRRRDSGAFMTAGVTELTFSQRHTK